MRLLVLNWLDRRNPRAGGAEIHLHESFGRLAAAGWEVTLVTSGWSGSPRRDRLDGMEVHRVMGRHSYFLGAPWRARRILAEGEFDLVVEDLNKVPLFAPAWSPVPVVLLVHHLFGETAFREANPVIASATWLLERPVPRLYQTTPVVTVSESTRQDLVQRGLPSDRIRVVTNGVDPTRFSPVPSEAHRFPDPTVLYLGRLKRYKQVELILEAMARIREGRPSARLLIVGRGDHERVLRRRAERLGLAEGVRFLGFVSEDEKFELLRRSWVHVLTSPKEGWGIVNLEAAAAGTPTVASDSPGLRDSVRDGETGFLVPHGDVGALTHMIDRVLGDPDLRRRLGTGGRAFAEEHSWDRTTARLGRVLEEAVASP